MVAGVSPSDVRADVCVIGTGPAGAIAAVRLAENGFRVLLVEAGGERTEGHAKDGLGAVDVEGVAEVGIGRAFQIGGSSNLWAGRVAAMEAIDLEPRTWIPHSGWPIPLRELEPYFRQARSLIGAPDPCSEPPQAPPGWEDAFGADRAEMKLFTWAPKPFKVALWLLERMRQLPALVLLPNARVTALQEEADGRVTHAKLRHESGAATEVAASFFILAAGGLEVPRILFNSTDRSQEGIGNAMGQLGRYFSTHPKADVAVLSLHKRMPATHPLFVDSAYQGGRIRAGIALPAAAQEKLQTLNHYVQLSPLVEYRASRVFEAVRGSQFVNSPLLDRTRLVRGVLPGIGLFLLEAISRSAGLQRKMRTLILRGFFDQHPDPENRLQRSVERDAAGVPLLDVRWRFTEDDKASVIRFLSAVDQSLRKTGIGQIDYTSLATRNEWPLVSLHSHFLGATRMGTDPRHSVTDPYGKVHQTQNVYIAGPSTFPTSGFANPFLTIAALSLRLGDVLAVRAAADDFVRA